MFFKKDTKTLEALNNIELFLKDEITCLPEFDYHNANINKDVKNKLESIYKLLNKKKSHKSIPLLTSESHYKTFDNFVRWVM